MALCGVGGAVGRHRVRLWLQCHLLTVVAADGSECTVAEVRPGCAQGFPRALGTAVSLSLVVVKEVFGNGLCPG